jgi:DNA-binding transcriptional regulator GbsR (MarR family)
LTEQTYNIITTYLKEQIDKLITKTRYAYKEVQTYTVNIQSVKKFKKLNQRKRNYKKALKEVEQIYNQGIDKSL